MFLASLNIFKRAKYKCDNLGDYLTEQFPQYGNNEWYFFTSRERKYPNGSRPKRTTNNGYWKATGVDKEIRENGILKGLKKTLVFYKGDPQHGDKTKWIMHEYRLVDAPIPTTRSANDMKVCRCHLLLLVFILLKCCLNTFKFL